jgi:hypothetical protein
VTSGADQQTPARFSSPSAPGRPIAWARVLLVVLVALALAATYGVLQLRAQAALDCRDMDAGLGFSLNLAMVPLAGANLTGACLAWMLFGHRYGASGGAAALVVTVVVLVLTSVGFFQMVPLPDGPLPGCPGGAPPWWPLWLPG